MFTQSLSLALAGSFYPFGILLMLRYLAGDDALAHAWTFLAGAVAGLALTAIIELWLLHVFDLTGSRNRTPNGTIDIVLGVGLLIIAAVSLRPRASPSASGPESQARLGRTFALGAIVYSPGLFYLAAIKAVANGDAGTPLVVLNVVLCIVVMLLLAELPVLATIVAPRQSQPAIRMTGGFIAKHGRAILAVVAFGSGVYLLVKGINLATT